MEPPFEPMFEGEFQVSIIAWSSIYRINIPILYREIFGAVILFNQVNKKTLEIETGFFRKEASVITCSGSETNYWANRRLIEQIKEFKI